jgi:hypothetical protein
MTKLHTVIETPSYLSDAKHCKVSDEERAAIVDAIAKSPKGGDLVQNTGGVRKVRIAKPGKGKSSGYRVITVFFSEDAPVYLLAMLSKGERANFSADQKKAFRAMTSEIKKEQKGEKDG